MMFSIAEQLLHIIHEIYFGRLFHTTSLQGAFDVLRQNQLGHTGTRKVSLSRSASFWFNPTSSPVRFIIDGNLLSQRYKLTPYDWYQTPKGRKRTYEYEIAVKGAIRNFRKYLLGIEVRPDYFFQGSSEKDHDEKIRIINRLKDLAKVPIYIQASPEPITRFYHIPAKKSHYDFLKSLEK